VRWCLLLSHAETAVIHARSLAMLEIENRPFDRDVSEPLLVARNLVRIYDQVLGEPLPAELLRLVARLETWTNPGEHRMAAMDDCSATTGASSFRRRKTDHRSAESPQ
jgi:hypothetical protein